MRFAGLKWFNCAKQDALRSFSEGGPSVYYVHLIESISAQGERYLGMTTDLKERLQEHNAGKSSHTSKFKPWQLTTYIDLMTEPRQKLSNGISNLVQGTLSLVSDYGNSVLMTLIPSCCDLMTLVLEWVGEFLRSVIARTPSTAEYVNAFRALRVSRPT